MEENKILSQCPACKTLQELDWIKYNSDFETILCDKCHTLYRLRSGIITGGTLTEEESNEYKFMKKLNKNNK